MQSSDINMWNHNAGLWASLEDQRNSNSGIASVDPTAPGDLYQTFGESYQYDPTMGTYQSINTGKQVGHPGETPVNIGTPYGDALGTLLGGVVDDPVDPGDIGYDIGYEEGGGEGSMSQGNMNDGPNNGVIGPDNPNGGMLTGPGFSMTDAIQGFSMAGIPGLMYGFTSGVASNNAPGPPGATGADNPSDPSGLGNPGDNATGGVNSGLGTSNSTGNAPSSDNSDPGGDAGQSGPAAGGATAGGDVGDGTRGGDGPSGDGGGGGGATAGGDAGDGTRGGW